MPLKNPPISPLKKDEVNNIPDEELNEVELVDLKTDDSSMDSREEFFKLMAVKIGGEDEEEEEGEDEEEEEEEKNYRPKLSNHYKKMIRNFSFLSLILIIAVAYFSFLKLEIIIESKKGIEESNLSFVVYSDDDQIEMDRAIKANISRIELEASDVFEATGEEKLGGEIVGKVIIKNEYSKNQPLVATTRILSSDDKLFRLKDTVNVPAGSSVEVDIYADTSSEEMAIGPDKFIIPGLWTGLQDKIYAESVEAFEFKKSSNKLVSTEDIENAKEALSKNLIDQAKSRIEDDIRQHVIDLNSSTSIISQSKKVGDEALNFEMSIKNLVTVISFETDDIVNLAKQRLDLETNKASAEILVDSFEYELVNFSSSKNRAELKLVFSARTSPASDDVNKNHLTNLNKRQIEAYLDNIEDIDSFELKFRPSFIKMSPLLTSKIFVEYK